MYSEAQIAKAKREIIERENNIDIIRDKIAHPDENDLIEFDELDIQLEQEIIDAIKKKYQL